MGELTSSEDLKFVEINATVEEATNLLIESGAPCLLIRDPNAKAPVVGTFDPNTLNAYLLTAVGIARPDREYRDLYTKLAEHAGQGRPVPLRDVLGLGRKEALPVLLDSANLVKAIETFGKGVHRVLIVSEGIDGRHEVTGLLSQTRLLRFLWEGARNFPVLDKLYTTHLRDLKIGSNDVVSIK